MPDLRLSFEPPVGRLWLDGSARRNAMTAAMCADLPKFRSEIEEHPEIDAVIVEGAGDNFCSGSDISEFDRAFVDLVSAHKYLGAPSRKSTPKTAPSTRAR